jgi:hypothetical protein
MAVIHPLGLPGSLVSSRRNRQANAAIPVEIVDLREIKVCKTEIAGRRDKAATLDCSKGTISVRPVSIKV